MILINIVYCHLDASIVYNGVTVYRIFGWIGLSCKWYFEADLVAV